MRPGTTSSDMKTSLHDAAFEHNKVYTLYNIKKIDDKCIYSFTGPTRGETVTKEFDSLTQGDIWISSVRREQLPDYTSVYSRNSA